MSGVFDRLRGCRIVAGLMIFLFVRVDGVGEAGVYGFPLGFAPGSVRGVSAGLVWSYVFCLGREYGFTTGRLIVVCKGGGVQIRDLWEAKRRSCHCYQLRLRPYKGNGTG